MKIAYTINGLIGGLSGKNSQMYDSDITPLIIQYTSHTVNKFITPYNDIDFYIFSWQPEHRDIFDSVYNPTYSVYTPQLDFNIPAYVLNNLRTQAHYSRWYGVHKISEMIKDSGNEYDLIINCRMDMCWNHKVNFNLDPDKIHIAYHTTTPHFLPQNKNGTAVCDHIIATSPLYFHQIGELFNHLDEYVHPKNHKCDYSHISNHLLIPQHLRKLDLIDNLQASFINDHEKGLGTGDYDILRYRNLTKDDLIQRSLYEL